MDDVSNKIADNKGMWRSSTAISTRKRSSREVGLFIMQLTKFNPAQILAVMAMNHDSTVFNIEFSTPENKQLFEAEVEKNKQSVGNFFRLKQPKVKTKSILCTHVPGSYNDERLHMQLFGKQKPRIISVATERCLAEDGSPLWATGRRWINVAAADFDQLRAVPKSIQIAQEWKIYIHMQKGSAGKCFICNQPGHTKQQCRELVDKPPETSTPVAATKTPTTEKQLQSNDDHSELDSSGKDDTWMIATEVQDRTDGASFRANIDTKGETTEQQRETDDSASSDNKSAPSGDNECAPSGRTIEQTERQIKINRWKQSCRKELSECEVTQQEFLKWLERKAKASNNDDEKRSFNEDVTSLLHPTLNKQTHFTHFDDFMNDIVAIQPTSFFELILG